jgi:hypothetical protein
MERANMEEGLLEFPALLASCGACRAPRQREVLPDPSFLFQTEPSKLT